MESFLRTAKKNTSDEITSSAIPQDALPDLQKAVPGEMRHMIEHDEALAPIDVCRGGRERLCGT